LNDFESRGSVESLAALIEELHRASSDARAHAFPGMARKLDECGFAFATALAHEDRNEHALVAQAQACLEMWRAVREW
jgi:hypothetical protein